MIVLLGLWAGLSLPGLARAAEDGSPSRFEDPLHGYSLRPPRGARRVKPEGSSALARWAIVNAQGNETLLRLDVEKVKPDSSFKPPIDLEAWKKKVIQDLAQVEGVEVSLSQIRTVAGKEALELAGRISKREKLALAGRTITAPAMVFRQLWLLQSPDQLLLVKLDAAERLDLDVAQIWSRLVASLTTNDPTEFLAQQGKGLIPARALLAKLTPELLAKLMPTEPEWFLLKEGEAAIGWQMMVADQTTRNDKPGWRVRQWSMIARPSEPIVLIFRKAFLDDSAQAGAWRERIQIGQGEQSRVMNVEGVRQDDVIVAGFGPPHDMTRRTAQLPEAIRPVYLPTALEMILPRLIATNMKQGKVVVGAHFTFAEYDPAMNDFPMRIFSLEGVEVIQHNGQVVQAVKAQDRRDYYHPPIAVYFDGLGKVLLERNQQGQTVHAVDEAAVLRAFPAPPPASVIRAISAADRKASLVPRGQKNRWAP